MWRLFDAFMSGAGLGLAGVCLWRGMYLMSFCMMVLSLSHGVYLALGRD